MATSPIIVLEKLYVVSHENGLPKQETARIQSPAPCAQKNAAGSLSGFKDLAEFRATAREEGKQARAALLGA